MAGRQMSGGLKCCITGLIVVAAIVVLLVVAVVIVLNMTPAQLKLTEIEVGGVTLTDLGLADTKLIDIIKQLKELTSVKGENIVKNPFNAEEEKIKAEEDLRGSSAGSNYSIIFTENVVYPNSYVKTFKDTTLAYIVDKAITDTSKDSDDKLASELKESGVSVKEITIGKTCDVGTLSIVAQLNVKKYLEEASIPNLFDLDGIYLTVNATFTVGEEGENAGKMQAESKEILINGTNNAITKALVKAVSKTFSDSTGEDLGQAMASAISSVVNHLGFIGSSTKDDDGISLVPTYGMSGVIEHYLTVITHTSIEE